MKGFVYMIEIATAAIIMTVILSMFFSIRIKQDWGSADLAAIGANMLNVIRNDPGALNELLMENYTLLDANRPQNAKYGLSVIGAPRSNLTVACVNYCSYVSEILSPGAYVNGRWMNFTVVPFDNNTYGYDAIVLVNYTSYSTIKPYIDTYLSRGGVVMGINDTFSSSSTDFNNIFGLSAGSGSSSIVNFTSYSPDQDEVAKIFLGIGMNVGTQWRIWNDIWTVSYSSGLVTLTNASTTIANKAEGSTFSLVGPNGQSYMFKVKKVWSSMANIQPLNKSFVFKDFSDSQKMTGSIVAGSSNFGVLAKNNSALWMSSFPSGNDYYSLMQAALLSRLTDWTAKYDITGRETTTVSSFMPLCCDMPETAELFITLWYEV